MERINCSTCGKAVSTEVPDGTTVRVYIKCPECIESGTLGKVMKSPSALEGEVDVFCSVCSSFLGRRKGHG